MMKGCKMSYLYFINYLYWSNLQYKPKLYEKDIYIFVMMIFGQQK